MQWYIRKFGVIAFAGYLTLAAGPVLAMGGDGDEGLKAVIAAIEKKDYEGAIAHLKETLQDDKKNADALNYMGYSYRKLGDFERALKFYKAALKIDPDHKGANEYIGEAYLELKQPAEAKIHLDRLAKICGPSCEEYRELKEAFYAYQATSK
ncbi:tetratricopeptide repeat protein [Alphaproteobacteria bacterium]|nr:tetratricopeptide repeat protein [Alphaproteobacteria bacterium]